MAKKKTNPLEPGVNRSVAINPLKPGVIQSQPVNPLEPGVIQSTPKGSYDQTKGGYTTPNGAFYPTSNPDFVPSETDSNINFLPNKNVKVSKGNVTQELTPQEYAVLQGKAGAVTNKVVQVGEAPNLQQQRMQELVKLSEQGILSQDEVSALLDTNNTVSNVATGGAALGGAVLGAKSGAALGTVIAPGLGTIIGGIVGAAGGAIGGAYVKLTAEKLYDVKKANKIFSTAKTNKQEILNMVNSGLMSEGQARELWQEEKDNIAISQSYLKRQTQNDLNDFLGKPGDDLLAIERYLALDNAYDLEFEKALMSPDPNKIRNIPLNND